MNKIELLIDEMCPEGVEFRALGEIGRRNKGVNITAAKMKEIHQENAPVKIFAGGKTTASIPYSAISSKNIITEPSIIVKSRGYIGFEYYDQPFSHKNELWSYTINSPQINQKFIYYFLLTQIERLQRLAKATSVKIPQLSVADTDKLDIPIPTLAIQKEIVKILDHFTELEAELEARKKQYEHYREELLSFYEGVEFRALGEVCDVRTGQSLGNNTVSDNGNYPYVNAGIEPSGYIRNTNSQPETITIPSRGQGGAGYVGYQKTKFWCGPLCYRIRSINKEILTKYLYYYLKNTQASIIELRKTGSIPAVNKKDLVLVTIPIPPLAEQKRIVAILDKFDALVNDIAIGLPAEIAARKKQYEYYRNQLLTFSPREKQDA